LARPIDSEALRFPSQCCGGSAPIVGRRTGQPGAAGAGDHDYLDQTDWGMPQQCRL